MTESFKNMLKSAKTVDEAYDIFCAHADEFTMNEQIKIFQLATGRSELTDDELDMVVGGSLWSSIKKATSSLVTWVSEHKKAVIAAVGAVAGVALFGIGLATGFIIATTITDVVIGAAMFGACGAGIASAIRAELSD